MYKEGVRWTECLESGYQVGKPDVSHMVLGHTNLNKNSQWTNMRSTNMSMKKLIIPFSTLFRLGYVDGRTLRQDTWYSWRRRYCETPRLGMSRQTWKLDNEGNLTTIRQAHVYCTQCKEVKQVVQTVRTKRV